jgi:hypothetical protein
MEPVFGAEGLSYVARTCRFNQYAWTMIAPNRKPNKGEQDHRSEPAVAGGGT